MSLESWEEPYHRGGIATGVIGIIACIVGLFVSQYFGVNAIATPLGALVACVLADWSRLRKLKKEQRT